MPVAVERLLLSNTAVGAVANKFAGMLSILMSVAVIVSPSASLTSVASVNADTVPLFSSSIKVSVKSVMSAGV